MENKGDNPMLNHAQAEAEIIKDCIIKKSGIEDVQIRVKIQRRGFSRAHNRTASIPYWAYTRGTSYFTYYVIHELTHQIVWDKDKNYRHDNTFKSMEKSLLLDYGLVPDYAGSYAKGLISVQTGEKVYRREDWEK